MAFSISRHLIMLRHRFSLQWIQVEDKSIACIYTQFNLSSQSLEKGNVEEKERKKEKHLMHKLYQNVG